jgi:predicted MPP superfamily phosphohydrolase
MMLLSRYSRICRLLLSAVLLLSFHISLASSKPRLNFRPSNTADFSTFKIVQITDIHLGEPVSGQDSKTFAVLQKVLRLEKPDLIILSGDLITSDVIDYHAEAFLYQLQKVLEPYNIPWALIFGNHDVTYYRGKAYPRTSRLQLAQADMAHPLSLTQVGSDSSLTGVSNYWLNVYSNTTTSSVVAARILLLDSGGGTLPEKYNRNQIRWFQTTNNSNKNVAVFAFQHLPTSRMTYTTPQTTTSTTCRGYSLTGDIDPMAGGDAGMMQALQYAGNVQLVAVSHNHGNDYCCEFGNAQSTQPQHYMHYCFGRHSGYGGAKAITEHGVRVYVLGYRHSRQTTIWKSYARTELGRVIDDYAPRR